jgi:hypothetical protein
MGQATEIVIAETALEYLLVYYNKSLTNARRIQKTIELLKDRGPQSRVFKFSDSQRPIWHHQIDSDHSLYFTCGRGANCLEVRIVFFGLSTNENQSFFKHLLYSAGEVPYHALPDQIAPEDIREVTTYPPFPERKLRATFYLESYLNPRNDDLLEALTEADEAMDDLHGRPFRILSPDYS